MFLNCCKGWPEYAINFRFGCCHLDYQPTSGNVGSVTGESGICANEGSGVETVSLAHSVQKLFPLPVLVATILNFGIQPKSGYVDISKSDLVEKVGVTAVEIVSL